LVLAAVSHPAHAEPPPASNVKILTFTTAKRQARALHHTAPRTFYCGCTYSPQGVIDWASCGYVPRRPSTRAKRLEWEHVVPAEAFGQSFASWREGHPTCTTRHGKAFRGRACARKVSDEFRRMEADLYNLVPAIGEINARRQNYSMAMLPGEARDFGRCDVEIANRKIEPRPEIRGDIARIYFYMDAAYPGHGVISRKNRALFSAWDKADPVDAAECQRARRIANAQGNTNPFVDQPCQRAGK
jgi:deoxyribonuclease I